MTPEERARDVREKLRRRRTRAMQEQGRVGPDVLCVMGPDDFWIEDLTAEAIRAAVAEEREACAAMVQGATGLDIDPLLKAVFRDLAAAIRARSFLHMAARA